MSGRGTGRWGLTSLRMLCARRKGFASKSLVPPLRLNTPPVLTQRHPSKDHPPKCSASADADQPFLRHSHSLRSYSPPPPRTPPCRRRQSQVKYGFSASWRPISWSLCSISSMVFLPQCRVMRRSSLEWVISSRTVWMYLSLNR